VFTAGLLYGARGGVPGFGWYDRKLGRQVRMDLAEDVSALVARGHELGCHTFDHCHSWDTKTKVFERSILENKAALNREAEG